MYAFPITRSMKKKRLKQKETREISFLVLTTHSSNDNVTTTLCISFSDILPYTRANLIVALTRFYLIF